MLPGTDAGKNFVNSYLDLVQISTMTDLRNVPLNVPHRVVAVLGDGATTQRIRELGLLPGARFSIVRKAPFGGPYEIALDRRRIGLRLGDGIVITAEAA